MEELFKQWTIILAIGVEACATLIIAWAALNATFSSIKLFYPYTTSTETSKENIRLSLGRWLALALEFELAADILRTAVAPSWNEIGQLAAIIILRTLLNYFLQKEIQNSEEKKNI